MELNLNCFDEFPVLKTERLTLRQFQPEDAEALFDIRTTLAQYRWMVRPMMETIEEAEEIVQKVLDGYANKESIGWAAMLRDDETFIGGCGFPRMDVPNLRAEIGGELASRYWGKGIAQEAFIAIMNYGIEVMNLHTIEAKTIADNRGAIHLMEEYGFVKEGHYRELVRDGDDWRDMCVYTLHNPKH